jgi:thiol:disulfide interchange protein DsbA
MEVSDVVILRFIVLFVWEFKQGPHEKIYAYDKKKPVNRKLVLLGNLLLDNSRTNTQKNHTIFLLQQETLMSKWLMFAAVALVPMALFVSQPETVQAQDQFVAGKDYAVIEKPVRTGNPKKVEVTEVFWYGCGHCNTFRPAFDTWAKQQSDAIVIRHSPAMWSKSMAVHARIFYTASALGKQEVMHKDIFDAMHLQKKKLLRGPQIFPLFEKHGVTKEQFDKTYKSFGVKSMVQQADARARAYGITGTPEIVVNGKYRISASMTGSQNKMMDVAEYLIKKEQASM